MDEKITISKADFERVALDAGRTTIQRMIELAPPEHKHIVQAVGERCLAEIGEKL